MATSVNERPRVFHHHSCKKKLESKGMLAARYLH